ncbi:hypothetical protein B7494_g3929 [Chlorociboria aeruginascens]|nr:hypothetical protein B7494_g3929 [Chlorociboria aeruginascens]
MSSDLLAEFDSFYRTPQDAKPKPTPSSNDLSFLNNTTPNGRSWQSNTLAPLDQSTTPSVNADPWGFLTNSTTSTHASQANQDIWAPPGAANIPRQALDILNPPRQSNFSATGQSKSAGGLEWGNPQKPTFNALTDTTNPFSSKYSTGPQHMPRPAAGSGISSHSEVLFDAAAESDTDEFGDFETVTEPPTSQSLESSDQLFGGLEPSLQPKLMTWSQSLSAPASSNSGSYPYEQCIVSPPLQERNPFSNLGVATTQGGTIKKEDVAKTASPVTAWPAVEGKFPQVAIHHNPPALESQMDDEWDDFSPRSPDKPAVKAAFVAPILDPKDNSWDWGPTDQGEKITPKPNDAAPPTNIPPPSVLLSLFPPVLDMAQSSLFKTVTNQSFELKKRIMSDPSTIEFLRAFLLIATVAGRIIAGRKSRWKRDTILSQAMKIGPTAAGSKGGMKLTGLDKTEITREDREVADVVRLWREQLGRIRSAVAIANSSMQESAGRLVIPELSEVMYVKTQKGGLTAPKPCLVCGLKRDERVDLVDIQVEDSFHQWWKGKASLSYYISRTHIYRTLGSP